MNTFVLFLLLGLGAGALYAGLAVAAIMQYRASGVINFATGAIALFGAWMFYGLRTGGYIFNPLPIPPARFDLGGPLATLPAFALTIVICAGLGVLLDRRVFGPLRAYSALSKLCASLGIFLYLQAIVLLRFSAAGTQAPALISSDTVTLFGVDVPQDRFIIAGIVIVATLVVMAVYRFTHFGIATRALADNERGVMLAGLSPDRISTTNTVAATILAAALGIIVAPTTQLDGATIALAIIPALAAALLANLSSFGLALVFGLGIGMLESELQYVQAQSWFPSSNGLPIGGIPSVVYVLILTFALLWRGSRFIGRGVPVEKPLPIAPPPRRILRHVVIALPIVAVLIVFLPADLRQAATNNLVASIFCLSLVVISGFVGQMSIAQLAIGGVSAIVMMRLTLDAGIGFPFAPAIAIVAATLLGTLISLPALRIRGVHLAIVTLAAAVALSKFWFENLSWGARISNASIPEPEIFGLKLGSTADFPGWNGNVPSPVFPLICALIVTLCAVLVALLRLNVLGKQMLAVRADERAAAASGINVRNVKLAGFAMGSFLAAVAGVMLSYSLSSVSAESYALMVSLNLIALAYVGGIALVLGGIVGALGAPGGVPSHILDTYLGVSAGYQLLLAGFLLVFNVLYFPGGLAAMPLISHPPVRFARFVFRKFIGLFRFSRRDPSVKVVPMSDQPPPPPST